MFNVLYMLIVFYLPFDFYQVFPSIAHQHLVSNFCKVGVPCRNIDERLIAGDAYSKPDDLARVFNKLMFTGDCTISLRRSASIAGPVEQWLLRSPEWQRPHCNSPAFAQGSRSPVPRHGHY